MICPLCYNILVLSVLLIQTCIHSFSLSFYWCQVTSTLCKKDIALRRTVAADPEGLHQRER